jgi:outer membrane protein assembly factor BamB
LPAQIQRRAFELQIQTRTLPMRAAIATSRLCRVMVGAAAAIALLLGGITKAQQRGLVIFGGPSPQAELTAPQVNSISGATASRLEQSRALVAAKNWDEAVDIYRELSADDTDRVVALEDGRCVSLRTYCHLQLARLPAEGLAAYRRRVDPLAERWYRDGLAARDEQLLGRVVNQFFCSSWGDDALVALGELALERADYDAARRAWEQINPLLRDPSGRPIWQALRGIDINANWPEIDRRWQARKSPADWLAYPDTNLDLAGIRARLTLASIRAGQLDRAALELDAFRRWHPDASGQLGGQEGPYVAALEKLLSSAGEWKSVPPQSDWPTFAGAQSRSPSVLPIGATLVSAWERPISLAPPTVTRRLARLVQGGLGNIGPAEGAPATSARESIRPLSCFPVVADGVVLFADSLGIHAASVATGKPAITADGVIYREEPPPKEQGQFDVRALSGSGIAHGVSRLTLNVVDHIAYGRVGPLATSRSSAARGAAEDGIVGFDLRREGLLTLRARPEGAAWSFDGTPVSDGRRLFVAMRRGGATTGAYVACFDATTGSQLWRTSIGSADTPAGGLGGEITHNLLTLVGDRIYFNTNLGLVAGLDANTGQICWLAKYARLTDKSFTPGNAAPLHFDRDPSPCLYHDGLIVVAPADTPDIFALDAETGKTIWTNNQLADVVQLLGAVGHKLVVSGNRLSTLDVRTGKIAWTWPESGTAGIRGMGRGLVAGNEIFWPTRTEIYALDTETGARTRSPISLSSVSDCGANLAVAGGRLIVAGYDKILAFGTPTNVPAVNQPKSQPDAVRTGRLSGQSKNDR